MCCDAGNTANRDEGNSPKSVSPRTNITYRKSSVQRSSCKWQVIQKELRERWGFKVKLKSKSKFAGVLVVLTALGLLATNATVASAVTKKTITCYKGTAVKKFTNVTPKCPTGWSIKKTITCYKGTAIKKVIAVAPKCPTGWTTKKPVAKVTAKPSATPTKATGGVVAFAGTYKGKMSVLWSESGVQASLVTATGTGTNLGLDSLSGTGSSSPQNQCDSIDGSGVLSGGGNTLKVTFNSSTKGCAADGASPTTVTLTGTATITGGTGKYAGATGTLKATGSFAVKSNQAGFGETTALTLTLTGNINIK
jgi:hypothetical protein